MPVHEAPDWEMREHDPVVSEIHGHGGARIDPADFRREDCFFVDAAATAVHASPAAVHASPTAVHASPTAAGRVRGWTISHINASTSRRLAVLRALGHLLLVERPVRRHRLPPRAAKQNEHPILRMAERQRRAELRRRGKNTFRRIVDHDERKFMLAAQLFQIRLQRQRPFAQVRVLLANRLKLLPNLLRPERIAHQRQLIRVTARKLHLVRHRPRQSAALASFHLVVRLRQFFKALIHARPAFVRRARVVRQSRSRVRFGRIPRRPPASRARVARARFERNSSDISRSLSRDDRARRDAPHALGAPLLGRHARRERTHGVIAVFVVRAAAAHVCADRVRRCAATRAARLATSRRGTTREGLCVTR